MQINNFSGKYDTLITGGEVPRGKLYRYNPAKGKWSAITRQGGYPSRQSYPVPPKKPEKNTEGTDSKSKSDKEFIEVEFNTLTGELSLTSTQKSIRIGVNDTIKIEGIGKYLSGLYFVTSIRRTLNKDSGYTHTLSLLKNGFGSSLKKSAPVPAVSPNRTPVPPAPPKKEPELNVGDKVKIVGDDAVYSNASDGVRVPNWVKKKTLTIRQVSSDKTRVLLMPIFSWTYTKYIKKV